MRRFTAVFLGSLVLWSAGCAPAPSPADDGQVRILCSFFPIYLFTKNIVGQTPGVSVELMLPAQAGCPHDYDLTPDDIKRIAGAEVYVMNGAGLESFGEEQIKKANPRILIVDSSAGVAKIESAEAHEHHNHPHEHKENDHSHDHDHDHAHEGHSHEHDHHHHGNVNPHFFSSPKGARAQVRTIAEQLTKIDPAHAKEYAANLAAFESKLQQLDEQWAQASKGFRRTQIVTMHEVFDYVARDCGLQVVATIYPVAGQEPSPAEIRQVIDKIRETKAAAVLTEPQYPAQVAKTIAEEAGVPVEELDPVASGPADAPLDYYETRMKGNIETLSRLLAEPKG